MYRMPNAFANHRVICVAKTDVYTTTTDTWCHWCSHPFATVPVGIPIRYNDRKNVFTLSGTYCSYACVLAANKERNDARCTERSMWIRMLAKQWHGISLLDTLRPAPHRRALKVFGGSMDILEFRGCQEDLIEQAPPIVDITPEQHVILSRLRQPQRVPATVQLHRPAPKPQGGGVRRVAPKAGEHARAPTTRTYKIRKPTPKYDRQQLQSLGINVE